MTRLFARTSLGMTDLSGPMAWRGGWIFSGPGGYDRPWDPGFPEIDDGEPYPDG